MVKILMMSAKMTSPALLKIFRYYLRYFEIKVTTSYILSMTLPKKFCQMTQIILWMWSCDQSLVTLAYVIMTSEVAITSIL